MMDPAQEPSSSEIRESTRKAREAPKRDEPVEIDSLRYREFFELAPDAYLITDVYGNIREANVAAGRMLSVEPRSLAGKLLPTFFDERARRQYTRQLDRCDFDRLDDWEINIHPRQGAPIAVSISIARSPRGPGSGYRWIVRDISRRTKADALLRGLKADFLHMLSHEFRTPLQAIFGYTELLERQIQGPLNDAQLRDLRRIRDSQEQLSGLVNTMLDFARLDAAEEVDADTSPSAVHDTLREMEEFIASQLEKRDQRRQPTGP